MKLFNQTTVNKSFEVSFILLLSISILTGIRSLNPNITPKNRLSLQLSTLVTIIASFHYNLMLNRTQNPVIYRYLDWFFTTPILLIDFCLMYGITDTPFIIEILAYNTLMLILGFIGELGFISMFNSMIIGFIPFILLFGKLYQRIKQNQNNENKQNNEIFKIGKFKIDKIKFFYLFVGLWSMYGFIHIYPSKSTRDLFYNILDILTKGVFGVFIYSQSW